MKIIALSLLLVLSGCGHSLTMEELEAQALVTGDWSAVEEREAANQRRQARVAGSCPIGQVQVCESSMFNSNCLCMSGNSMQRSLRESLY
ncbi:MAG: hypothetical protein AAF351_04090 [Pseudomonadota bacterium]